MKRLLIAIALLLCPFFCAAATKEAPEADPFKNWMNYYYMSGDSSKVPDYLKWLQESGALEKDPAKIDRVEGFLSVIFADNAAKANEWAHSGSFTGKTQTAIDYAVKPPVAPELKEIKTAEDIDTVWGSFYASGKELYLKKIVDALDTSAPLSGNVVQDGPTRAQAAHSLGVNMTPHEAVERYIRSESEKRTGAVGDQLKHIVADVSEQRDARASKNRDGEFSAVLIVADPNAVGKALAESVRDNTIRLKESAHARTDDKRTFVIFFGGMALSPDYQADVTYDVKLVDPEGKTYLEKTALVALKDKVPTRFRMFNNKDAVFISFDRKDTKGTYNVSVTLKDNIGKKSIPLTAVIAFKK